MQLSYNYMFKSASATLLLCGMLTVSANCYAAKGDTKNKKGVVLKFSGFNLKGNNSFNLFSKYGFLYSGSFSNLEKASQSDSTYLHSVVTLQKGNTTFIYPYKYRVRVSLFKTPSPVQR